jgi:outer membrane protein OmpA-like peptidoglycan-associated protein
VPETLAPAAAEAPPPPKLVPQAAPEGTVSPEFEKKAKAILADRRSPESLTMPELRQRLIAARDILAKNMLSASTEGALRKRLLADRNVFRARQAEVIEKEQAQQEAAAPPPKPAPGTAPVKPRKDANSASTPVREVLRDKRQAEELSPRDLRRRMRALREAEQGQVADAPPESGELRRERLERDRTVLRRRLLEEREQRRAELQREDVRIVLERAPVTTREVPRAVFEAETDEDDLERIIVSAPRRRITQRYTVEEVAAREDLRDTMPRIEIDTIRFGFGESFVREEEVGSLDRIALIIERVLRGNPNEVFLIEGHTDAVGSDAFNTNLSRQRAEAVKQALTTYYIIPGRNLKTVGLGERYLRIPTPEPEAENRRVSLIRATPLLGELQD